PREPPLRHVAPPCVRARAKPALDSLCICNPRESRRGSRWWWLPPGSSRPPDHLHEAAVGAVEVEHPCTARTRRPEAVDDAGWRRDERPGADAGRAVGEQELDLALEDVEGVDVVVVAVLADLERWVERD